MYCTYITVAPFMVTACALFNVAADKSTATLELDGEGIEVPEYKLDDVVLGRGRLLVEEADDDAGCETEKLNIEELFCTDEAGLRHEQAELTRELEPMQPPRYDGMAAALVLTLAV